MTREHVWDESVGLPTAEAKDWHCKYKVVASRELVADATQRGNTIIDVEMEGFDDYVYLILQAHDNFEDIGEDREKPAAGAGEVEVQQQFRVKTGSRFIIPAEQDVLITFAPVSNGDGIPKTSRGASIAIRAVYRRAVACEESHAEGVTHVLRPGQEACAPKVVKEP